MVKNTDNFIMLPTVDFCFKELMKNDKVRKGFVAAICDMETGELYTDLLELHTLELKKLPPEAQNEKGIIHWMRFLGGKKREEFEDMAKQDEYIGEAYEELKKLSLDDQKRLEYELRQKAIRDYNSQMKSAREDGRHDALRELIGKKLEKGMLPEDIAELFELELDEVRELAEEWKKEQ